ncbi:MAG: abhydrolase domain-containing 18, partial [Bryobacteraceae bacterium]
MPGIYARWIDNWERKLATRDTNRVVRPFEWGLDWLGRLDFPALPDYGNGHPREALDRFAQEALGDSDRFFSYRVPSDYQLREGHLTFTSPVESPYPENNTVHAQWFPAERSPRRAVLVLPQWNAGVDGHVGLAKLLNRFGASALRMSMAYHAERMPAELQRADYHVSS